MPSPSMRQLVLAFVVFILGWTPAAGQPTAADSALVDDLMVALQFDRLDPTQDSVRAFADAMMAAEQVEGSEALVGAMSDMTGLADSARALFLTDLRPDLIHQAISVLSDTALQAMYGRFQLNGYGAQEMARIMQDAGDRPLADSVLVANYVDAVMTANAPSAEMQREIGRQTYQMMVELMPGSAAEVFSELGGEDGFLALIEAQPSQPVIPPAHVRGMRALLHGYDEDVIRRLTRYYESEAGIYVSQSIGTASQRAMMPRAIKAMRAMFESALAPGPLSGLDSEPEVIEIERPDGEPGVYEVVDTPPTLVGGLEGLMERVVYPEAARREDVEGRVFVQFVVNELGTPVDVVCVRSPDPRLCAAAVAAVEGSTFTPGRHEGQPVRVLYTLPVDFALR